MTQERLDTTSSVLKTRRLTWWYIAALSIVALLTLTGQVAVQHALHQLEGDAGIVNIAGRQRMLSQRLPLIVLELEKETDIETWIAKTSELKELATQWETSQRSLAQGSSTLARPGHNHVASEALFQKIEPDFLALRYHVQKLIQSIETSGLTGNLQSDKESRDGQSTETFDAFPALALADRQAMLGHSDAFLRGMDRIVSRYAHEAEERVTRLRWTERCLLLATLSVLLFEGCFIFSPSVASLQRAFAQLQSVTNQLSHAKDTAESANRAKTAFLARLSHELRTPLHAILGMMSELRRGPLQPKQIRRVQLSHQSARTLQSLVNDLLDVAGIETGTEPSIHCRPVRLARLIQGAVELMEPIANKKGLSMNCAIDPDIPQWISADPDRLRQVVYNLLQNAIRYTEKGRIACKLQRDEAHPEKFSISISDTGRGIAPEDRTRIFASFERAHQSVDHQAFGRSLGLGLPITVSIVKAMGGNLKITSEEGRGSCFTVQFPFVELVPKKNSRRSNASSGRGIRKIEWALVVDDSPTNRILMRSYLRRLGYKTIVAANLSEASIACRDKLPSVIVLDKHLDDEDGLSLISQLQKATPGHIPEIYLVTADIYCQAHDLDKRFGIAAVLHKPLTFSDLKRTLKISRRERVTNDDFSALRLRLKVELCHQLPNHIDDMIEANRVGDLNRLGLLAHRLRGASGNAGLNLVADQCGRLEACADRKDREGCSESLTKLGTLVVTACNENPVLQ
jgi:signal transduction histidine kinase/CheY-like chemotaxis protein